MTFRGLLAVSLVQQSGYLTHMVPASHGQLAIKIWIGGHQSSCVNLSTAQLPSLHMAHRTLPDTSP